MAHDPRLIKNEDQIEELRKTIPNWIIHLQRVAAPVIVPRFGPLEGIRVIDRHYRRSAFHRHEARGVRR